ncbi:MAG: Ig-like domain-containing protein [Bacteroidota bacterium]
MKKLLLILLLQLLYLQVTSQALGYNNNRIAVSADGNNQPDLEYTGTYDTADPDDWAATPASLIMIAKLQLQDKLVHYSYNNFMPSPPHTTERNYMKEACDQAIDTLLFNEDVFFDVGTHQAEAIESLKNEIVKSTADDPLYFIHMGPAEFFYQVIKEIVDDGTHLESLSHVYIISHSGYNDTHLRRDDHHTLPEAITLSGDRLNYQKIIDQNNCKKAYLLWCSGTGPYQWRFIRDHEDPYIQWLWKRMSDHPQGKYDISDAGMVYYLFTGDENGSPAKFTNFLGYGILLPHEQVAERIDITEASVYIYPQKAYQLDFGFTPEVPWDDYYSFATSDASIAYVSPEGRLVGVGPGTATITITAGIEDFTDEVVVTVIGDENCFGSLTDGFKSFDVLEVEGFAPSYKDSSNQAIAVDASQFHDVFGAARYTYSGVTGYFDITITSLTESAGESTYKLKIADEYIGTFQNPVAATDFEAYTYTFSDVLVRNGNTIQIESNTHSNETVPEGGGFAFSHGRWKAISMDCSGDCEVAENDGLLVIEAERFNLQGQWQIVEGDHVASGNKYIEYTGPNRYNGPNVADEISYTFNISNPGTYTFKWFMRQPDEAKSDLSNDVWIKMEDSVGLSGGVPIYDYAKFVGRSKGVFAMNGAFDINHQSSTFGANFPEAGDYTIKITGRSEYLQFDRVVFYKNGIGGENAVAMASAVTETTTCSDVMVTDADQFNKLLGISFAEDTLEVSLNESKAIHVTYAPADATNTNLSWAVQHTDIVTIEQNVITGIAEGIATVTVVAEDGDFTETIVVRVSESSGNEDGEEEEEEDEDEEDDNDEGDAEDDPVLAVNDGNGHVFLYPNPIADRFRFDAENTGSLDIISMDGRLLRSIKVKKGLNIVSVGEMKSGHYVFWIKDGRAIKKVNVLIN